MMRSHASRPKTKTEEVQARRDNFFKLRADPKPQQCLLKEILGHLSSAARCPLEIGSYGIQIFYTGIVRLATSSRGRLESEL